MEYYGIGYKISLCDKKKDNYIFKLGHKQKRLCYSSLTSVEDERGTLTLTDEGKVEYTANDKTTYDFSFYDNQLYLIKSTSLIPIWRIENEETWATEMLAYFDVIGIDTTINKLNETTYEMVQTCNLPKILKVGFRNKCSIDYYGDDIFGLTKTDISSNYHKNACK